tara:strand:- start:366 stop:578 length:213 start_codon:yes stop_codon:yes gene_type:complete
MSKIKNHFHEEITHGQQTINVDSRIAINTLITLTLLNLKLDDNSGGFTSFYLSKGTINSIEKFRDELDRL